MRCEHHPAAEATAQCGICEIPICGVCSNYTATTVLCDRCVNSVAMSDLFASRAGAGAGAGAKSKTPRRATSSSMSKLLEEGKSLNLEIPAEGRKRKPRSKIWDGMHVAGIFGCFIFIGIQLSSNFGAAAALSPQEVAAEERLLDQINSCVQVFWEIAEVLKNGEEPGESLRCPEQSLPYIIARQDNDIVVRHPSPQLLGYTDIFVTRNNPVPILVL